MRRITAFLIVCIMTIGLCACSSEAKSADLQAVLQAFSLDEEEMLILTADDIASFYGIDSSDVKQFAAAVDLSGICCDEYVLCECADEAAAGRVQQALTSRIEQKMNEMKDYLPEQYDIISKCSVERSGLYVAMIVSPDAKEQTKIYNDSFK